MTSDQIPPEIQSIFDRLVAVTEGHATPHPNDIKSLEDWLQEDGHNLLLNSWISDYRLDLASLALAQFSDAELRGTYEIDDQITDALRLEYARERIEPLDSESPHILTPHSISIKSSSTKICCLAQFNPLCGFLMVECLGAFKSDHDFLEHLDQIGVVSLTDGSVIADELLLDLWHRNRRKKRLQSSHPMLFARLFS